MGSCFSSSSSSAKGNGNNHKITVSDINSQISPKKSSVTKSKSQSQPSSLAESQEKLIQDRVLEAAAALVLKNRLGEAPTGIPFDRSTSVRAPHGGGGSRRRQQATPGLLPRSSTTRPRSSGDPLLPPPQLLLPDQDVSVDGLETNHFVLVHGGGFGAWCWYKTIALLKDGGFRVNAIDLTGSGVQAFDSNNITSLSQYVEPLTSFLENLGDEDKVILVGHDLGGACISYAMEAFPSKIAKAVFVSASMLMNGQSALDMFTKQVGTDDLMRRAQIFQYANGKGHPPTAIDFDKSLLDDLLFNQSPGKDVALASVSMRPIPFAPVLEKLSLSDKSFGSVRRFYIETTDDNAIPLPLQQSMCDSNPPERVFQLKGSDHSPFFSKPQALHKHLVEIAKIPAPSQDARP